MRAGVCPQVSLNSIESWNPNGGVNKKRKVLMLVDQRFVLISRTSGDFAPVHELSTHGKDARPARSPGGRPSIRGPVTP